MSLNKSNVKKAIKKLSKLIIDLIYPPDGLCYICGEKGDIVCAKCSQSMRRHENNLCRMCGRTVPPNTSLCRQCEKYERPYDGGAIALYYEDTAREVMKDYKFKNKLPYSDFFAEEIYKSIKDRGWEVDAVTAVPSHIIKVMGKGYNPPALIAKKLAQKLNTRYCGRYLRRKRYTKSMSLLKGIDRMAHVKKNFSEGSVSCEGKNLLLIDDVSTTGATLHICSQLLKKHGACKVYVASACGDTFAYTGSENDNAVV